MKKYRVNVNGTDYEVTLEALKDGEEFAEKKAEAPKAAPAANVTAGAEGVKAPMPGTILDVKVAVGATVKSGDVLCILEAMKMENEIQAPKAGKVVAVNVAKGASVKTGDVLVVLE